MLKIPAVAFFILNFPRHLVLSLRVNLDMGKMVFSWMIKKDSKIPGTVVRASTIPEQLGRISYLLTDKTGKNQILRIFNFLFVDLQK